MGGILFGGWLGEAGYSNELFSIAQSRDAAYSLTLSPCMTTGALPSPRAGHAACVMNETQMVIMGGASGGAHLSDLYIMDCETLEWTIPEVAKDSAVPKGRSRHAMECLGDDIFCFGGSDDETDFDVAGEAGVWRLSVKEKKWEKCKTNGEAPSARWGLTAAAVKGKIYLWGGQVSAGKEPLKDVAMYVFDKESMTFEKREAVGQHPSPRGGHSCTVFADRYLVIFGGGNGSLLHNDCLVYDTIANEWMALGLQNYAALVPPRWAHTAVGLDGQLVLSGGANGPMTFSEILVVTFDLLLAKAYGEKVGGQYDVLSALSPHIPMQTSSHDDLNVSSESIRLLGARPRVDPLQVWLHSLGLEEYFPAFAAENISMRMVPFITEEHLDELGITQLGARLNILMGIHQLKSKLGTVTSTDQIAGLAGAVSDLAKAVEVIMANQKSSY